MEHDAFSKYKIQSSQSYKRTESVDSAVSGVSTLSTSRAFVLRGSHRKTSEKPCTHKTHQSKLYELNMMFNERISVLKMMLNHDQKARDQRLDHIASITPYITRIHSILNALIRFNTVHMDSDEKMQDLTGDLIQNAVNQHIPRNVPFLRSLTKIFALNIDGENVDMTDTDPPNIETLVQTTDIIKGFANRLSGEFAAIYNDIEGAERRTNRMMKRMLSYFKGIRAAYATKGADDGIVDMIGFTKMLNMELENTMFPQVKLNRMMTAYAPKLRDLDHFTINLVLQYLTETAEYIFALNAFVIPNEGTISKPKQVMDQQVMDIAGQWVIINKIRTSRMLTNELRALNHLLGIRIVRECSVEVAKSNEKVPATMMIQRVQNGESAVELTLHRTDDRELIERADLKSIQVERYDDTECSIWLQFQRDGGIGKKIRSWILKRDAVVIHFARSKEYKIWKRRYLNNSEE